MEPIPNDYVTGVTSEFPIYFLGYCRREACNIRNPAPE